jgi:hypothetical protein
MTNPQVKERIETLSASVESCMQRAEFILRSLDSIIPMPEDAASASATDLTASHVIRAANGIVNELRQVGIYYRTQLAKIAEDEKTSRMPALAAAPEPIDEAARRRQQLSAMADEQTRRATAAASALTAAQEQEARNAQLVAHNLQMQQQQASQALSPARRPCPEDLPSVHDIRLMAVMLGKLTHCPQHIMPTDFCLLYAVFYLQHRKYTSLPNNYSYFFLTIDGIRARDDLCQLLSDRSLTRTVVLQRQFFDHLFRVVRRRIHCSHSRAVLTGNGL